MDYTRNEPDGVMVEVIKRQPNIGEFVLIVTPLSYDQFDSMGLQLPTDLPIDERPDPAERMYMGKRNAYIYNYMQKIKLS